jgi:hypothetical protein
MEIILCILPDHRALKLELHNKNNSRKYANNWKLNNTLLNDEWVIDEIKEEIKSFLEVNENENTTPKLLDTINSYSNFAGHKISLQKSLTFLYTNNEQIDKEYMETIPFT